MKELFQKAIEWLRSRVTAIRREEGKVKREEVKDTQSVYADDNLLKVKGDRLKVRSLNEHRCLQSMGSEVGDLPPWGDKRGVANRLTIPDIEALLR